jgi:Protein of unknown function (DUF998)
MMTQKITAPARPSGATSETTRPTRALLACGVVAGPLFLVVALLQALTRDGFDPGRHPLSLLSLGELGWIQITNFVVAGLLSVAFAVGMRRVLHPGRGGTWGPLLFGTYWVGLIGGGAFLADPGAGFPPGAPAGAPEQLSWHGILHDAAHVLAFLALIAACFVLARRFAALGSGAGRPTAWRPGWPCSGSWRGRTGTRSWCSWPWPSCWAGRGCRCWRHGC